MTALLFSRAATIQEMVGTPTARSLDRSTAETVNECRRILRRHYGDRLAGVLLYGSMATGRYDPESDVDLLVLLSGELDYFEELRTIIRLLQPLQLETDRLISARPAAAKEVEQGALHLYRNALEEGIRL